MKKLLALVFLVNIISLLVTPITFADDMGMTTSLNTTVSATLYPQPPDYQFSLTQQDGGTSVSNGRYYAYTITYGAKKSAAFNTADTVITFDWSQALAGNQYVFDYVFGSASDAYGNAKPAVDTSRKTITWKIPNLPPGTVDQKVTILLFSNSYQNPPSPFPFYLTASMTNQYATMPDQTLTEYYNYQIPPPGPTTTPGPQPTAAPTPMPTPLPLPYNLSMTGITDTTASIQVATNNPSRITLSYGTSQDAMNQTVSSSSYQSQTTLSLSNLTPNTPYYFRLLLADDTGRMISTETYMFTTAKASIPPSLGDNIVVFTSNGTIFFSKTQKQIDSATPSVILTTGSNYEISYTLAQGFSAKSIEIVLDNTANGKETAALMSQKTYNSFSTQQQATTTGVYDMYLRITDMNGNIEQRQIADLKITQPMTIFANNGQPLSDARVFLYYYDEKTQSYLPLSPLLFGNIPNPSYTDANGQLPFTLPPGKYRAGISALFYDNQMVNFTIGSGADQNFPQVSLKSDPANLSALTGFVIHYLTDTAAKITAALLSIASSITAFHVIAVTTVGSFSLLSYLLFMLRSHIQLKHLPVFLLFGFDMFRNSNYRQKYIFGRVTDEDGLPLSRVLIAIEDAETKNIIAETATNKLGKFYFRNAYGAGINLLITKPGFAQTLIPSETAKMQENGLRITLLKGEHHHISFVTFIRNALEEGFGLLFEVSLVISVILEVLFFIVYGLARSTPFLILSVINMLLWFFYLHEHRISS